MLKLTMRKILEQFDASRPKSYQLLTSLLELLDNYLRHS